MSPHDRPFVDGLPVVLPGGGLTGVQLFFVLSGFLITTILVAGIDARGAGSFPNFYARRAVRLLPALFLVCATYLVVVAVARDGAAQTLGLNSILAAATYTSNLPVFANDNWLGHTWTLAVEEQFYLVWPLVLLAALRLGGRRTAIGAAVAIVVATAVARHTDLLTPVDAITRLRWDALLVGALIALVPMRGNLWIGLIGLVVLGYYTVTQPDLAPDAYLITALAAAAIIISVRDHHWLTLPALQFFGLISYGLYLWHVLILRFGWPGPVSLLVSVVVATASYAFIELRFLRWHAARREDVAVVGAAATA